MTNKASTNSHNFYYLAQNRPQKHSIKIKKKWVPMTFSISKYHVSNLWNKANFKCGFIFSHEGAQEPSLRQTFPTPAEDYTSRQYWPHLFLTWTQVPRGKAAVTSMKGFNLGVLLSSHMLRRVRTLGLEPELSLFADKNQGVVSTSSWQAGNLAGTSNSSLL